jgi:phosphatidylglycerol:prolipoprotein diacylglycerol transferase
MPSEGLVAVWPFLLKLDDPHVWIHSYYVLIGLAIGACLLVGPRWAFALEGIEPKRTRRLLLFLGLTTFLGGDVHYLVNAWHFVLFRAENGSMATLLWPGIHAPGAVLGLLVGALAIRGRTGISLGKLGDALVPTVGLGIAVARLGCLLHGCCYGVPCSWPWCITFPEGSSAWNQHRFLGLIPLDGVHSAPVHPLQLYFSLVGVLLIGVGFLMQPRKRYDGQVALVAIAIFSASSLLLEGMRAPFALRAYWRGIPQLSWVLLAMTLGSVVALLLAEARRRRPMVTAS